LVQDILSIVPYPAILAVRQANRTFYKLTTGYDQPGLVGVENRPSQYQYSNTYIWSINEEIDFREYKLSKLTSETIPSFPFYRLMGQVKNLPKEFWPYLEGTRVHTLDLSRNQIGAEGASQLAQHLQGTSVHTLDLSFNQIGDAGASQLAQHLQGTSVHTLDLSLNQIGTAGASQLAQHLEGTRVHILDLSWNQIGAAGASQLAQHLQGSSVHTLNLNGNQIGDPGAIQLAQHLQGSSVHTLHLGSNRIGNATQQLLKGEYPHINWIF